MELRIFRVIVIHVFQCDPGGSKFIVLDVIPGGWSADIVVCAHLRQDLHEPVGFLPGRFHLRRAHEACMLDAQFACQGNRQVDREIRQEDILALVEGFEQWGIGPEKRRPPIGKGQCLPVGFVPGLAPIDLHLFDRDRLFHHAGAVHRDGQPLPALRRFDLVAIAPAVFIVLDIIVKNKYIRPVDLVEIPTPGDVGWLQDDTIHG